MFLSVCIYVRNSINCFYYADTAFKLSLNVECNDCIKAIFYLILVFVKIANALKDFIFI